jgi:cyclopropane fatty-acyl-phospholipid synthase-like methyltransferase
MTKDHFSQKAKQYESNTKRVQNVTNIADSIKESIQFSANMHIMDFGSGTGLLLERIAPLVERITAIDISESMMTQLLSKQDKLDCELHTLKLDLAKESIEQAFDGIISSMTLHHIKDVPAILKKFCALLLEGGFIAIADLDSEDGSFHDEDTGVHHHGFNRDWIMQQAQNAGFERVKIETVSEVSKPQGDYPVFLLTGYKATS